MSDRPDNPRDVGTLRPSQGDSEIILLPDGRVYVHGTTRPLLEILAALQPSDPRLRLLAEAVQNARPDPHS